MKKRYVVVVYHAGMVWKAYPFFILRKDTIRSYIVFFIHHIQVSNKI